MHSTLNLILMTRDKDLRRWGRLSAVLMIFLGCFLLCSIFYTYHLVQHRLEPALHSSLESEQKLIEKISDHKIRTALSSGLISDSEALTHLLKGLRAVILGGGIGFAIISFYSAALAWRAYELASARAASQPNNEESEQAVHGNTH
jgi:hypothetical protein